MELPKSASGQIGLPCDDWLAGFREQRGISMSIRRLILSLFALALLLGLGIGVSGIASSQRVTKEDLERVERGMSRDEVMQTVGRPPGDYCTDLCVGGPHGLRFWDYESWRCNDGELFVLFDEQGIATDVVVCDVFNFGPPSFLDRVRGWLGL